MRVPFVGPTYPLLSAPASVQRTVNMVPVPLEPGNDRTAWVFRDVPGLVDVNAFPDQEEQVFSMQLFDSGGLLLDFSFNTTWPTAVVLTTADFCSWNAGLGKIEITTGGVYEVGFSAQMDTPAFTNYDVALGTAPYGLVNATQYPDTAGISCHHVDASSTGTSVQQISDVWLLTVAAADSFFPTIYGTCPASGIQYEAAMTVTVRRLGDIA